MDLDPRVREGLELQLADWRRKLASGARRVGWKLGLDIPEVEEIMGAQPVVGHLVSTSMEFRAPASGTLRAETELGLGIGRRLTGEEDLGDARDAIRDVCVALELVDVGPPRGDVTRVLAGNVFHRAFAFGEPRPHIAGRGAALAVNGVIRGRGRLLDDYAHSVLAAARLLAALGESLEPGDRLIAGSAVHVPVTPGDRVNCAIDGLGEVKAAIDPGP